MIMPYHQHFFAIPSTSNAVVVSRTQPTQLHQTKSVQITNSEGEKTGLYNQQEQKATMDNGYEYHVTISNHNPTTTPITPKKGEELIGYRKNPEYKKGMMGSAKQFEMYGTLSSKKNITTKNK